MATKGKITERVQNYPSLFPELEGEAYGGSLNAHKKPRRRTCKPQPWKGKGKELTSREKRNSKLWAILYPISKK
jgi:hypothetical protein